MPSLNRRSVLKGIAAGGLNLLLPGGLYAQNAPRRPSPNGKLRIAVIGVGGRGKSAVAGLADEEFAAFCDVDSKTAADSFAKYPDVPRFTDFNEMLAKLGDTLDGVAVMTPDHGHFSQAMAAVAKGKHVYVEKPLCQTIDQTRKLLAATTKAGVKTQMGNQGHSSDRIRDLKEWYDGGALGRVMSIDSWTNRPTWPQGVQALAPAMPVPDHVVWDLWKNGKDIPYSDQYVPFKWRGWTPWGTGALGDMACHILDPLFYALDPGPPEWIKAEAEGGSDVSFPLKSTVTFHFPEKPGRAPFDLVWRDGRNNLPARPGVLESGREMGNSGGGSIIYGSRETVMTNSHAADIRVIPQVRLDEIKGDLPEPTLARVAGQNHFKNWTDAIRGNVPEAASHFEYAARLNELVLLGVIAQRLPGEKLDWDAASGTFRNSDRATRLTHTPWG